MGETLEMFERRERSAHFLDKLRAERFRRCFDVLSIIQRETDIPFDTLQPGELTVDHLWNASHGELVSALVHIEQHTARARDEITGSMQRLRDQIAHRDDRIMRLKKMLNSRKEIYDMCRADLDYFERECQLVAAKNKVLESKLKRNQRQLASERQKRERRLSIADGSSSSSGYQIDNPTGVERQVDSSDGQGILEYSSYKVAQQGVSSEDERTDEGIAGEKADRASSSAPAQL
ncbi:hypothetical protein JCM9279_005325 [Rhodotorula babjevae]